MLNKIIITSLAQIKVPGGDVYHSIKKNEDGYKGFGEAYFSFIKKNAIKGWKKHKDMSLNLTVPVGKVLFVFMDGNNNFREEIIGEKFYNRVTVPPGLWFGFKNLSRSKSLILNIADICHDPKEVVSCDLNKIPYNWDSTI